MIRKPAPLRRGDCIGVISPGAAVNPEALRTGVDCLEAAGFRVCLGDAALARHGYLAGSDGQRRADLEAIFADPEVRAVIASRGGYGCGRLLTDKPILDPALPPKIFAGHSDLTFLFSDILARSRMVVFHAPMVAGLESGSTTAAALFAALCDDADAPRRHPAAVVRDGVARGVLVGGCLAIVAALLGTPHAVPTADRILFLEDRGEKPFRIDRMLVQLRQAGAFARVAGVVFGEMVDCTAGVGEAVSVRAVVDEHFADAPFPVLYGVPSGHGVGTAVLPFGVAAEIADGELIIRESPFAT